MHTDGPFDVLVAGPSLSTKTGLSALQAIHDEIPTISLLLAFAKRPDSTLREIIRAGAVDLLQLPVVDKSLHDASNGPSSLSRSRQTETVAGAAASHVDVPEGHGLHHLVGHRGLRQDVPRHQPGLLPRPAHREAHLRHRPRPAVRRGHHRPAAAAPLHDLRRPPAGGHRRRRPASHIDEYLVEHETGFWVLPAPEGPVRGRPHLTRPTSPGSSRPPAAVRLRRGRHAGGPHRGRPRRLRPVRQLYIDGDAGPAERPQHGRVPQHSSSGSRSRRTTSS